MCTLWAIDTLKRHFKQHLCKCFHLFVCPIWCTSYILLEPLKLQRVHWINCHIQFLYFIVTVVRAMTNWNWKNILWSFWANIFNAFDCLNYPLGEVKRNLLFLELLDSSEVFMHLFLSNGTARKTVLTVFQKMFEKYWLGIRFLQRIGRAFSS